jgi:RsiW-degrading membrane proteinase PrsW (M82 family)
MSNYLPLFLSPLLIVILLVYMKFKFSIKDWKHIITAIILGVVAIVLLIASDYVFEYRWHGNLRNMRRTAAYVFVGIAFASEFAKFLVLRYAFIKKELIKDPLDGIIYAFLVGLGFTTIASVLYSFGIIGTDKVHDLTMFLWIYPLGTLSFSIVLGYFMGMGYTRKNSFIDDSSGLFLATFFHAIFYFGFITSDVRLLVFILIGYFVIGTSLLVRAVNLKP